MIALENRVGWARLCVLLVHFQKKKFWLKNATVKTIPASMTVLLFLSETLNNIRPDLFTKEETLNFSLCKKWGKQ